MKLFCCLQKAAFETLFFSLCLNQHCLTNCDYFVRLRNAAKLLSGKKGD